jgi:acyl-CoA synthetase (AMP-forming)/AMP-acid ligase II
MLTHRNLLHNLSLICSSFALEAESRIVSWLPPYHDMGLIGVILGAAYSGAHATLLSPLHFLQRPLSWLRTISDEQATHCGGPDFAYNLCVQRTTPEQRASLDLRTWRVAFDGAEPVRPGTMERFAAAFAPAGFSPRAFAPCYGLAECTLLVATHAAGTDYRVRYLEWDALGHNRVLETSPSVQAKRIVACGTPRLTAVIADPETRREIRGPAVGEIWVRGPSVAAGYWNLPAESAEAFQAYLSDSGDGPFLRTGDLGFLRDGELFVTGRCKDTIIICGRNIYAQDIEVTSQGSHQSVMQGGSAAFSISDGEEERLVVVQECRDRKAGNLNTIRRAIRNAIAEEHGVAVHAVELVRPGSVPRTSSGKVQRYACKAGFSARALSLVEETGGSDISGAVFDGEIRQARYEPHPTRNKL